MEHTFTSHLNSILSLTLSPSLEDLNVMTGFLLGLKRAKEDPTFDIEAIERQVHTLHTQKKALKFVDRFTTIAGSNHLTPKTKEKVLLEKEPFQTLASINVIAGKTEATERIKPFMSSFQEPEFHTSFLQYETEAFNAVVGALIERLESVVRKMEKGLFRITSSAKNTLKKLYHGGNVGKTFLSIDLRQANWSALKHWDSSLPNWEDFLTSHLPEGPFKPLFLSSKNFRQVTLGVAFKKHNAVKMVETTQIMLIGNVSGETSKIFGEIFCESNDELIYAWNSRSRLAYDARITPQGIEKSLLSTFKDKPNFRLTKFQIREKTYDDCFVIDYEELGTDKKYTLLRCATPDKVEARLA